MHKKQKQKNQLWCIVCFLIVFTTIFFCIKSYLFISFENPIERAIMFPLYSITYPTYDHGIDYHTHQPLLHIFTRINHLNAF
jgi:hypothetical protein